MRNLIEYRFTCENLFFKYLKNQISLDGLITALRLIETRVSNKLLETDKELWFKFGEDDTLSTTISDIEKDLADSNRVFRLESFKGVIGLDPNNELKLYFS